MTDKKGNVFDINSKTRLNTEDADSDSDDNKGVIWTLLHILKAAKERKVEEIVVHTRSPEGKVATFQAGIIKSPLVMSHLLKEMADNYNFLYGSVMLDDLYDDDLIPEDKPLSEEDMEKQIFEMQEAIEDILSEFENPEDFED
jgi:hypothetical protein